MKDPLGLIRGNIELPEMVMVRQSFDIPALTDIPRAVADAIVAAGAPDRLRPGMKVAVTAGSRGIRNNVLILKSAVDWLRAHGAEPFVIGAMGSHGGGTAVGQKELLASLGVTEESVGCPVLTSDDTSLVGVTSGGHETYCDSLAYNADAILVINRVKPHTSFRGPIESGVTKIMAVGLGKARGATYVHMLGPAGMAVAIPAMGELFVKSGKILAGLAILENAFDETAEIVGLAPDEILEKEPGLLRRAKDMMPTLPVDDVDVLVVLEMGKNYSGTGMDTNILGRFRLDEIPDAESPRVKRLAVLDLSEESHGNATGIGLADVCTMRIMKAFDRKSTFLNCLTSTFLMRAAIPPAMDNDWAAIALAGLSLGKPVTPDLKVAVIANTLHLGTLYVSTNMIDQVKKRPHASIASDPVRFDFDDEGNLKSPRPVKA